MWKEIIDQASLEHFTNIVGSFHDSCIKEMRYLSGAYVDEELSMYPVNSERSLRVIFQRQSLQDSMIEVEFVKLIYLKLAPLHEKYSCEILDSTIFFKDGSIIWCDCGGLNENNIENYRGTIIASTALRWRTIGGCMGQHVYYKTENDT